MRREGVIVLVVSVREDLKQLLKHCLIKVNNISTILLGEPEKYQVLEIATTTGLHTLAYRSRFCPISIQNR